VPRKGAHFGVAEFGYEICRGNPPVVAAPLGGVSFYLAPPQNFPSAVMGIYTDIKLTELEPYFRQFETPLFKYK